MNWEIRRRAQSAQKPEFEFEFKSLTTKRCVLLVR
jgi:hypothetical protein